MVSTRARTAEGSQKQSPKKRVKTVSEQLPTPPRSTSPMKKSVMAKGKAGPSTTKESPKKRKTGKQKLTPANLQLHDRARRGESAYERPPATPGERLRQCINFLSDEGPENCKDFEEKLARIEKYILQAYLDGEIDYDVCTFEDVAAMVRMHRARIAAGKESFELRIRLRCNVGPLIALLLAELGLSGPPDRELETAV
ncbi:hypothetical protein LTR66_013389 [Elasticomyces elasticus]|nr:hypothetical protein LTR28_006883 [Elasticomyces elasticus]KAK4956103.1 hypothetical protein LTR66_013389 [Elasticomyces elasticus]